MFEGTLGVYKVYLVKTVTGSGKLLVLLPKSADLIFHQEHKAS